MVKNGGVHRFWKDSSVVSFIGTFEQLGWGDPKIGWFFWVEGLGSDGWFREALPPRSPVFRL